MATLSYVVSTRRRSLQPSARYKWPVCLAVHHLSTSIIHEKLWKGVSTFFYLYQFFHAKIFVWEIYNAFLGINASNCAWRDRVSAILAFQ